MKVRGENGITLVALVITIIVLLILAGVSLSLTLGENGILTRSQQAKSITDKTRVKEVLQLGVVSSYGADNEIDIDALNNNLRNIDGLKYEGNPISNANKISKLPAKIEIDGHKAYINEDGDVNLIEKELTAAEIAASPAYYYGKTVNYPIKIRTTIGDNQPTVADGKWKIFYSNGTNIFVIPDGYVQYDSENEYVGIPTEECYMLKNNKYFVYWSSESSRLIDNQNRQDSLFMATKVYSWAISKLLNTGIWSNFVNPDYADYAIGTPTLEMWVASINDKYPKEHQILTATNDNGYYMYAPTASKYNSDTNKNMYLSTNGINHAAFGDKSNLDYLYFPHKDYESGKYGNGYWLASPSAANPSGQILNIGSSSGTIWYYGRGSNCFGIRPVVSLNSKVILTEGKDGYDYTLNIE